MKKIHHFILRNFSPLVGQQEIIDKNIIHQVRSVLSLKTGEEIIINDGGGKGIRAVIKQINKKKLVIDSASIIHASQETKPLIRLYCSVLKGDHFEWVIEKATELGAQEIIPLITARTIKTSVRLERLEKIAQEAAEQCERGIVPYISQPLKFSEVISNTFKKNSAFIFDMSGSSFLAPKHNHTQEINLFIGPEGGWADEELEHARKRHVEIISLGSTILRAETAAVVSCFWASRMLL